MLAVPLCTDGEDRLVTEETRREYVELYINHVLNTSVHRQVSLLTLLPALSDILAFEVQSQHVMKTVSDGGGLSQHPHNYQIGL